MVESFSAEPEPAETTTTESNTATYAVIMVSVFTFGEFIMAPQWARISDRIGRKPTLLIGSVGAMISALAFGLGEIPLPSTKPGGSSLSRDQLLAVLSTHGGDPSCIPRSE